MCADVPTATRKTDRPVLAPQWAAGTTNGGVGGSFVDLPAGAQIGCDGKRALLPASVAGKTGMGMMTLPGTGDVTIRVRLSVKPLPTTAAQG